MPGYSNPGGGGSPSMSMYDEDEAPASPKDKGSDEEGEDTVAVIPKSMLVGKPFKPGDTIELEIVHIGENDVQVKYHWGDEKGKEEHAEPHAEPDEAMAGGSSNPGYD